MFFLFWTTPLFAQHINPANYGSSQQKVQTSQQEHKNSSIVVNPVNLEMLSNQTESIGRQLKNAGITTLSIGLPIAVAGAGCLLYGFLNYGTPVDGYTTSAKEAAANPDLRLISTEEYAKKAEDAIGVINRHENSKIAGYVLISVGGSMTLVSIPLIVAGNHIIDMTINCGSNGIGVGLSF